MGRALTFIPHRFNLYIVSLMDIARKLDHSFLSNRTHVILANNQQPHTFALVTVIAAVTCKYRVGSAVTYAPLGQSSSPSILTIKTNRLRLWPQPIDTR